jgi:ferredoxin-NADP reductase
LDGLWAQNRPGDADGDCLAASGKTARFHCGPTALVEAVADYLLELGYEPERIKTERFGPTGG